MALEKVINQKGQALLESLAVLTVAGLLIILFMHYGLRTLHELALSEIMENRLLCELENANHCEIQMTTELKKIQFKMESSALSKNSSTIQLKLTGQILTKFNMERTLERFFFDEKF